MNKQISALMDKVLTKGMALMESEKVQKILSSPQAQRAMDFGIAALTSLQNAKETAKTDIASGLGLATQKDLEALRESLEKVQIKIEDKKTLAIAEEKCTKAEEKCEDKEAKAEKKAADKAKKA
ncbi:MAG: hypothetical protein FWC40_03505 [Proteobacteria bacterium]|nr:hypothetical protein [Pseudomonadota bacterium]